MIFSVDEFLTIDMVLGLVNHGDEIVVVNATLDDLNYVGSRLISARPNLGCVVNQGGTILVYSVAF
jgi:hypothetical protein